MEGFKVELLEEAYRGRFQEVEYVEKDAVRRKTQNIFKTT